MPLGKRPWFPLIVVAVVFIAVLLVTILLNDDPVTTSIPR